MTSPRLYTEQDLRRIAKAYEHGPRGELALFAGQMKYVEEHDRLKAAGQAPPPGIDRDPDLLTWRDKARLGAWVVKGTRREGEFTVQSLDDVTGDELNAFLLDADRVHDQRLPERPARRPPPKVTGSPLPRGYRSGEADNPYRAPRHRIVAPGGRPCNCVHCQANVDTDQDDDQEQT